MTICFDTRMPQDDENSRNTDPCCAQTALMVFERQVLVFPLIVVILACTSFLFGGRCASWQWWTAVAVVVVVPFTRRGQWRLALRAALFFALLLFALRCLIPPLVWDRCRCPDMSVYHLPMVQLLIEGWNPVADPMAESITTSLGLDLWGMAPLHVAFLPKTMAVFSAVAYTFVQDPFALMFPGPFLLWFGVLLSAIRLFRGFPRLALVAALCFVLPMVISRMPVDLGLAFASCGLLLTMQHALRRGTVDWLALVVWCAWMMNIKLNGVLGAFVFCALFALAKIWKERGFWKKWTARFVVFGVVVTILCGLVSWHPLGTSWKAYGHPLYPFKTVDAERFPIQDLTWDLEDGNDDFREMGKLGRLSHAYISPKATLAYYRWKTGRNDFSPDCEWWAWFEFPDGLIRAELWLAFAVLLLLPAGRLWGIGGLLLIVLVPDRMAGFTRYQPWLSALGCLAVVFAAEWVMVHLQPRLIRGLSRASVVGLFLAALVWCWDHARGLECKAIEMSMVRERIRPTFWGEPASRYPNSFHARNFVARYNYLTCMENRTRLLVKQLGHNTETIVESTENWQPFLKITVDWDERNWRRNGETEPVAYAPPPPPPRPEKEELWYQTPYGYFVPDGDRTDHFDEYFAWIGSEDSSHRRFGWKAVAALHAWIVTYPREVGRRLFFPSRS